MMLGSAVIEYSKVRVEPGMSYTQACDGASGIG